MSEQTITQKLQTCLDRMRTGDNTAIEDLFCLVSARLTVLARRMLRSSYGRLKKWEETDDVAQNVRLRLLRAFKDKEVVPGTAREFYGLASLQIRRELLDLCRHHFGRPGHEHRGVVHLDEEVELPAGESSGSTYGIWEDFHEAVQKLPPNEGEVFDLLWYQGLPVREAAEVLGVNERTVKRRWRSAKLALAPVVKGFQQAGVSGPALDQPDDRGEDLPDDRGTAPV